MKPAVFLDRDGVLNKLVYNPKTGEYESPHHVVDLELCPGIFEALRKIGEAGYLLFLVSNQPSFAKGKTSLENIQAIHQEIDRTLKNAGVQFAEYYYCYHHPNGIIPEYTLECECRKPKPYFVLKARDQYQLDIGNSWFVGDQDSDIFCGQAAGLRTVLITEEHSAKKRGNSQPDFIVQHLQAATDIIIESSNKTMKRG